jgi:signal transduction histidine kinase
MTPHYDPLLVGVSIGIAIMASYVALDLAERVRSARSYARSLWWAGGSLAMGVGIWSMHFVGMLAFHLPVPIQYDIPLVLLSVLVAIAASALALWVASRPAPPFFILTSGGLLMGGAISGMHYIGMAAMRLPAVLTWRPLLVIASVAIAITASFVALLLALRLRRSSGSLFRWLRLWAAVVMGAAISGMHYTAMAAARFTPAGSPAPVDTLSLHTGGVAVAVTIGTVVILSLALASAAIDDRARLLAREQRARHEAETANRLKDEFLATLSHELRTPLNVILGRAHMLRGFAQEPDKVTQIAETITHNGELLRHLVEDLLDVSRITLGGMQLEWQRVDVAALLDVVVAGVQPGAQAKAIRLTVASAPDVPPVMGDPTRLQQVIWNLVANAVKFTPAGEIRIVLHQEGGEVVLTVTDTGEGIDAAFLPHVFDMFRQAESASSRTHGGIGVGLSIVRRLVELHGGSVCAESDGLGHGARFSVRLPSQRPVAAPDMIPTEPAEPGPHVLHSR